MKKDMESVPPSRMQSQTRDSAEGEEGAREVPPDEGVDRHLERRER